MNPVNVHDPVEYTQGDTWKFEVDCTDENGLPLDLTNVQSIVWKLDSLDGLTNYITLTLTASADGQITVPDNMGKVLGKALPVKTAAIVPGDYRDSLVVTLANGDVTTQSTGAWSVTGALK